MGETCYDFKKNDRFLTRKFFHVTPIGKGYNIGNFAISISIRKALTAQYPNCTIVTIPAYGTNDSGLSKGLIYEANQWADGIIVGGGNLYENNELEVDFNALLSLKVPLILFSISLGKIYLRDTLLERRTDTIPDEHLVKLHKFSDRSLSRDIATYKHLKSLGIDNTVIGGCPTLSLSSIVPSKNINRKGTNIFLSIRNPELMNIPRKLKLKLPSIIKNISCLIKDRYGIYPTLLCHDQRDLSFASSFENLDMYFTSDIYEYLELLNTASLVISMRVHATLPCLSYGIPVVNLSYDERALSLMETIGYSEWDINLVKKQDDLINQITERIIKLDKLTSLKVENANLWEDLSKLQFEALSIF